MFANLSFKLEHSADAKQPLESNLKRHISVQIGPNITYSFFCKTAASENKLNKPK